MNETIRTPPFSQFEWLLSGRYLRARRKEGFISVIAGFSFLGIMLGVATLIIVMAVMNGFRKELLDKILGLNGHLLVQPLESPLTDWKDVAERISHVQGIRLAAPVVDGQALASSAFNAAGVLVRGMRADDLNNLTSIAKNIKQGTLEGFDEGQGVAIGRRLADTPCPPSKPSSVPCLMFLAIEVRLLRSSARMPRISTPAALKAEDASA